MAALVLRADRWQVHHLGTEVPMADVIALAAELEARIVVLSLANPEVAEHADDHAAALSEVGATVMVGRPGSTLDDLLEAARAA